MTESPGGPLTDSELADMLRLLARFAEHELDQWDNWQFQTRHGPVYLVISRALLPGWPDDAFTPVWPLPPRLRDRSADQEHGSAG